MWIDYATVKDGMPLTESWTSVDGKEVRWMRETDMQQKGVTAGVKKILKAVKDEQKKISKKQNFFQPKKKK